MMRWKASFAIVAALVMCLTGITCLATGESDAEGPSPYYGSYVYGATTTVVASNGPIYKMTLSQGEDIVFDLRDPSGNLVSQVKYTYDTDGYLYRAVYNQTNYTKVDVRERNSDSDLTTSYFNWSYGPSAGSWVTAGGASSGLSNPFSMHVWMGVQSKEVTFSINPSYTSKVSVKGYMAITNVSFNANGGTGTIDPVEETTTSSSPITDVQVTMPLDTPSRTDYTFMGWATSKTATSGMYDAGQTVTLSAGSMTKLYAFWKENTVNVTLMDGDSVYEIVAVRVGGIPTFPSNPVKEDYTFMGWFSDPGFNTPWDTSTTVSTNIILYAGWAPDLKFTTDPVANCKVTKLSASTYMFDATVSENYSTSAASVVWKVYKGDVLKEEYTGPYMTYQFLEYGDYTVELTITNSLGVSSVYKEDVSLNEPSSDNGLSGIVAIAVLLAVMVLIVWRVVL